MPEKTELYLKAGTLVHFTTGEYSDYTLIDSFVALTDVTQAEVLKLANKLKEAKEKALDEGDYESDHMFIQDNFMLAMKQAGWILEVVCTEHHIGSYGDLDIL